ncbi:MAG: isopenicillin N synthase family oxygenase [Proteobacteria bacterium]|nr:isopenicillin N synthase family oxygenase [Pseudomonadota bacterium]
MAVDEIPVIDVAALQTGGPEKVASIAAVLRQAAQGPGFFYIKNHGVPRPLIDAALGASHRFFALPIEQKRRVAINTLHRGFLALGGAKMYDKARVDLKESYLWGLELGKDDLDVRAGKPLMGPNNWPDFLPGFRDALYDYYQGVMDCGRRLLSALAVSLDAPVDFFEPHFAKPLARGSLIYYPPQPADMGEDQFGVAPHSDYGGITLLYQDDKGGLQVRGRSGEWVMAHPIADTFVINIGDLMARWTNDRFASTPHRVVNSSGQDRYSIALFFDPAFDTVIDPADLLADKTAPHYPPITCGEYVVSRFDKAFSYRKDPSQPAR